MINPDLTINTDLAREILTGFVRSEITRVGMSRAIINLSGGLDSALSCALAVAALTSTSITGMSLKSPISGTFTSTLFAIAGVLSKKSGWVCRRRARTS